MASIMARRYGPKATEKIGRTMHEFKRGKLRSGSGGKVRSRQQAIAIGISQARRAGYKVPAEPDAAHASRISPARSANYKRGHAPDAAHASRISPARSAGYKRAHAPRISPARHAGYKVAAKRGHASMSLDAQVRTHLGNMRPGTEVDARGLARALGGVDPLEVDYALERMEKERLASTSDGKWFGPAAKSSRNHAKILNSPLVHVEGVVLPNGSQAEIHIHYGKGGYTGVLVSSRGNEVPMSLGAPAPKSMDEAIRASKKFLQQVYGKSGDSGRASSGSSDHSPIKLKDRERGHVWLTARDGRVVGVMGSDPARYMGMTLDEARHLARYGGRGASARRGSHAAIKFDTDDARMFGRHAKQLGQTRAQTLVNARTEGFAAAQLGAVEAGWEAEHSDTMHGGYPSADSSHAVRRRARAPRVVAYEILFTPGELQAIEYAMGRYSWPDMLSAHADDTGAVGFTEGEMWQWADDVDKDAEGGHSLFPLTSPAFAEKLQRFYDSRV
jgi:hypothetical protein